MKLNRLAWTLQVLEAVVGWVASTVGMVEVLVVVVAGAQLLSCVPWVLARIHSLLAVTLATNQSSVCSVRCQDQCRHPPGVHPRVAGERAAPPPADHAHQRVEAVLQDHEGAAGVSLARVLARIRRADVHTDMEMWNVDINCTYKASLLSNVGSVSLPTLLIGGHSHIDLLQSRGLVPSRGQRAPACHSGHLAPDM